MPSKRLFIGIPLTLEIKESISYIKNGYPDIRGVRWTKTENLHITLIFIGNVDKNDIDKLVKSINNVTDRSKTFRLSFYSLKTIKKRNIPLMFWVSYKKDIKFDMLHQELFNSIRGIVSLKKEHKQNIPHVTMARLKFSNNTVLPPLPENITLPDVTVDKIVLWESMLLPDGPEYIPIQTFKLK